MQNISDLERHSGCCVYVEADVITLPPQLGAAFPFQPRRQIAGHRRGNYCINRYMIADKSTPLPSLGSVGDICIGADLGTGSGIIAVHTGTAWQSLEKQVLGSPHPACATLLLSFNHQCRLNWSASRTSNTHRQMYNRGPHHDELDAPTWAHLFADKLAVWTVRFAKRVASVEGASGRPIPSASASLSSLLNDGHSRMTIETLKTLELTQVGCASL